MAPPKESHEKEQFEHVGATVNLACNVKQRSVRIRWTKNSRPIPPQRQQSDGSLHIPDAKKSDSGHYVCVIEDRHGSQTNNYINLHIGQCMDTGVIQCRRFVLPPLWGNIVILILFAYKLTS